MAALTDKSFVIILLKLVCLRRSSCASLIIPLQNKYQCPSMSYAVEIRFEFPIDLCYWYAKLSW